MSAAVAFAGHPMLSEDTGTQGKGNFELELGYDWSRLNGDGGFLFQPQLSYGLSSTVDLIVQPSWTITDGANRQHLRALGDTNLDAKWRFFGAAPWSLGIRAGFELPTAADNLGLPHDKISPHAIMVVTADYAPLSFDANLGYAYVPTDPAGRTDLYHFSAAATFAVSERLFYVLDAAVDSNPDPTHATYIAVALAGLIYTVHPGLDIDVGYRGRLNAVGPAQQWLLGITFRGAP